MIFHSKSLPSLSRDFQIKISLIETDICPFSCSQIKQLVDKSYSAKNQFLSLQIKECIVALLSSLCYSYVMLFTLGNSKKVHQSAHSRLVSCLSWSERFCTLDYQCFSLVQSYFFSSCWTVLVAILVIE